MTPKPDERLVDPRVADAWREASTEEPAASVDAAILAAARREVSARPEALAEWRASEARASRRRWWPLAAAATVAAIAVGVLQLTPTDKLVTPATDTAAVSDVPAPAAKTEREARPAPAKIDSGVAAPTPAEPPQPAAPPSAPPPEKLGRSKESRANAEAQRAPAEPRQSTAASSPDPFPAAGKTTAAPGGDVGPSPPAEPYVAPPPIPPPATATAPRISALAPPMDTPSAAAGPPSAPLAKMTGRADERAADDARARDRKPLPVNDWIALIRRLRAEGRQDEAAKELAAFRTAHPDHDKLLPPDLRAWRPQVK